MIYLPRLWSLFISYIPAGEQTNFNLATPTAGIIIYTALIPYSAPLIGKYIKRTYSWMNILCCLVPALAIPVHFLYHDKYALEEDFHNLEQAAEAGDWNTVKELTNNGKAFENASENPCVILSIFSEISAPGASRTACPTLSKR